MEKMRKRFRRAGWGLFTRLVERLPAGLMERLVYLLLDKASCKMPPADRMRFLLELDAHLYQLEGQGSVAFGGGVHSKHRHIGYHDFFIRSIDAGETVLDIGCGNGALDYDIARKSGCGRILAVDHFAGNIAQARKKFSHEKINYVVGDARDKEEEHFDVVVLSNILEHLKERVAFLKNIRQKIRPNKVLIRVPVFERDWRVPLKKELGLEWRLDPTHETEYVQGQFERETSAAGFVIVEKHINWGEIWAVLIPGKDR